MHATPMPPAHTEIPRPFLRARNDKAKSHVRAERRKPENGRWFYAAAGCLKPGAVFANSTISQSDPATPETVFPFLCKAKFKVKPGSPKPKSYLFILPGCFRIASRCHPEAAIGYASRIVVEF